MMRNKSMPVSASWGVELTWTKNLWGTRTTLRVEGLPTWEAAWHTALRWAREDGWTPPRWWQWWRWHDTRIPRELPQAEAAD